MDDTFVMKQLRSSSVLSYAEFMKCGFPTRIAIQALYETYQPYIGQREETSQDKRTFCKSLLRSLGLTTDKFKFGQNLIFFRANESVLSFEQLLKPDQKYIQTTKTNLRKWVATFNWRVLIKCILFLKR